MPFFLPAILILSLSGCSSALVEVWTLHREQFNSSKNREKENTESPSTETVSPSKTKEREASPTQLADLWTKKRLVEYCVTQLSQITHQKKTPGAKLQNICEQVTLAKSCLSEQGRPIFHYDRLSQNIKREKRILAIALIHGDEAPSGNLASSWMKRLERIKPRNYWRVMPIVNPDGLKVKSRVNINGVDLNRNFPTKDWPKLALRYWREKKKSDPRRFPGNSAASEKETQCLVKHIKEFRPDFIISVHTPYGVLDFDGPKNINFPRFRPLPWISLGNYPGSLGRYMWVDQNTPVLTIELKGVGGVQRLEAFDRLQDLSGTVAIQSSHFLKKKTPDSRSNL